MNRKRRPSLDSWSSALATWAGASLLAATLVGCAGEKASDPAALRAEIEAANKQLMETFSRGDAAALAGLYAEDGQALPPGSQVVEGRPAIEAMFRGLYSLPVKALELETREVVGRGDDACEIGRYRLVANDGSTFESGKYVVVWRRGESGLKIYRDIWNADAPASALPPAAVQDSMP